MAGQSGFGAKIEVSGPAAYGVGLIRSISHTGINGETIDISSNANTDRWRTFARAMGDAGTLEIEAVYEDNDANLVTMIETDMVATTATTFTVTLPDPAGAAGTTIAFSGLVTSCSVSAPYDDVATVTYSIKMSGAPNYTA